MQNNLGYIYQPSGIVRASGPDSATFLQGQFSKDLNIEVGKVVYGLWLDRKGKIVADSFVLREAEDSFLIVSYHSASETIIERLDAYIIMDEVELDEVHCLTGATVWGAGSDLLDSIVGEGAPQAGNFSNIDGLYIFEGRRGRGSLEMLQFDEMKEGLEALLHGVGLNFLDSAAVDAIVVEENLPVWGKGILSSDLPQEVGLGESAVSYNKGCYLGQEVMARIKSMGKVRRELSPVFLEGVVDPIEALESAYLLHSDDGGKAGDFRPLYTDGGKLFGFSMVKTSVGAAELRCELLEVGRLKVTKLEFSK